MVEDHPITGLQNVDKEENKNLSPDLKPEDSEDTLCFVCYQNKPNVIISPCNHCELCQACMSTLIKQPCEQCPLCKTSIKSFRVFEYSKPYDGKTIKILEEHCRIVPNA